MGQFVYFFYLNVYYYWKKKCSSPTGWNWKRYWV